jgi:hypothetical protein
MKPFHLKTNKTKVKIVINDPDKALDLDGNLEKTHNKLDRSYESLEAANKCTSNEIITGIETTEKMLKNGTILFVFGRLEKIADNSFVISRSSNKDCPFILTKENRWTLIDNTASKLNFLNAVIGIIYGIRFQVLIVILNYLYKILTDKIFNKP